MSDFKFKSPKRVDERAAFANEFCKLLFKEVGTEATNNLLIKPLYDYSQEYIRNIYELIDSEIPLFALYELRKLPADNWDMSEKQHKKAIGRAIDACHIYYSEKQQPK